MERNNERIVSETTETTIDLATGDIVQEKRSKTVIAAKEPSYIKLYLADVLYLKDMPTGLNSILLALLQRINYKRKVVINSSVKREIAEETNKKFDTVNKAITQFVQGQILIRTDVGMYIFNPHLFGQGDWKDIRELRTTVTYNLKGRTFKTEIERVKEDESI